jgi:hypothetical protein
MKKLISIEVEYHEGTAAMAKIGRILDLIEDTYGVREVRTYEDELE